MYKRPSTLFSASRLSTLSLTLTLLLSPLSSHAAIEVELQAPNWEFLLQNQPLAQTEAQLTQNESRFASTLQPLLASQDHNAVLQAFENRDIENDSAALRQLRGQVLLTLKRYKEAEQALTAALDLMPDLALSHRSLSMVYMIDKQYNKARQHLRRAIELGVADAQVYGQLAYVNLQLGNAASALAGYQYALFLDPDNRQWSQGLLYALINSQAFDQAQALLDTMLKAEPDNTDLWLQRSQIALQQERPLQAISSLETALQLGDNNVNNLATMAQLHIQNGSPNRAVELLATNIKQFVGNDANSKIHVVDQICAWLAFQQQWPQLEKLTQALEQNDTKLTSEYRSRFALYRAQIALSSDQQKSAKTNLEQAIKDDPSNGEALLTLANLLRDQHSNDRALLYYVRAEALPNYKERALLGHAQLEINRQAYTEALRLLRQVAQANPTRSDVLANIQSLESLVLNQS
jgi:tetratricopeptide (TPR) repeat protein